MAEKKRLYYDDLLARLDALEALVGIYSAGCPHLSDSGGHLLGGVSANFSKGGATAPAWEPGMREEPEGPSRACDPWVPLPQLAGLGAQAMEESVPRDPAAERIRRVEQEMKEPVPAGR
jgi:hypothetical protein